MKASVIILVWNGMAYLEACLNAVLAQDYPDFEVIVVDNASTDGSADFVAARYPQVRLIRNARNLGFAAGNNVGLRAATGDILVLLNQDTEVRPGWLAALAAATQTPRVGIAGGKAYYPDGRIQHAGGYVDDRGEGSHFGVRQEDRGQFDAERDVDYVTGAALAITRTAFQAIGALDEAFAPVYYEDVDWCYRARQAGFRVLYAPQARLVHKEESAAATLDYAGMYMVHRHRIRFVLKHWPVERLLDVFAPAEQAWLESLGEGAEALIAALHHAYLYHLLNLADVMDWRGKLLDAPLSETDALANMLVTLRAITPLKPARLPGKTIALGMLNDDMGASAPASPLAALNQTWKLQEHEFHSDVPVIGRLIAGFRRLWNRVATKWYVKSLMQQQTRINGLVLTTLVQHAGDLRQYGYDHQRLGEVLAEYIGENGREIAELAQEIRRLNSALEALRFSA